MMPRRAPASESRTCFCSCGGKKSMMRLMVSRASVVCRVDMTKWPVSDAASAALTVSVSRISPTRMTSGSCRIAARSAVEKSLGVDADLALVDHRELVVVEDLDRVLDRDDVDLAVVVDVVDHAGERRGLARPGRTGDEHQAARLQGERGEHGRQAEVVERDRADADATEDQAGRAPRAEGVDAEPADARRRSSAKSASLVWWNSSTRSARSTSSTNASVSAGVRTGACSLRRRPSMRTRGGDPPCSAGRTRRTPGGRAGTARSKGWASVTNRSSGAQEGRTLTRRRPRSPAAQLSRGRR